MKAAALMALTIGLAVAACSRSRRDGAVIPPLSIETIGIEPTVAMTGDILTATYRVRFQDLIAQGKEIVVIEDRMAPDKLPLAPFEAVGLEVEKHQIGPEHVWEFRYRAADCGAEEGRAGAAQFHVFLFDPRPRTDARRRARPAGGDAAAGSPIRQHHHRGAGSRCPRPGGIGQLHRSYRRSSRDRVADCAVTAAVLDRRRASGRASSPGLEP